MSYGATSVGDLERDSPQPVVAAADNRTPRTIAAVTTLAASLFVVGAVADSRSSLPSLEQRQQQTLSLDELPVGETDTEAELEDANADSTMTLRTYTQGYNPDEPTVRTNLYPWKLIVEPFKETVLVVDSDEAAEEDSYTWTITSEAGEVVYSVADAGSEISFEFAAPTTQFSVAVERFDGESGESVDSVEDSVMNKYVRREFRDVTDEDLEAYFDAMEIFVNTDLDEGRELYGDKFVNSEYLGFKHSSVCIHGGLSFFTGHIAFTMEVEQTLQLIDPSVTEPVWNYVLDAQLYGSDFSTMNPLFSMEQFGPVETTNENHWIEGRLAGAPMPDLDFAYAAGYPIGNFQEPDGEPAHNSFGILTTSINQDPSQFATRAGSYCDLDIDFALPGCDQLLGCLDTDNLGDLRSCMEPKMDGFVHKLLGGWFDCPLSLLDMNLEFPELSEVWGRIGYNSLAYWDDMSMKGYIDCPDTCDASMSFSDCLCTTSESKLADYGFSSVEELDFEAAYDMLDGGSVVNAISKDPVIADFLTENDDGYLHFDGLTEEQSGDVWVWLGRYLTNPGKIGTLETQSSAADPLFWALHPILDKTLSFLRLTPAGADDVFDYDWPEDDKCYGFGPDDTLPFQGLFGEELDNVHDYVNTELFELLDPVNPNHPYVYADFDFGIQDDNTGDVLCYVEDDIDPLTMKLSH